MGRGFRELIEEANRRRVFRTTGVYVVAVWGLSQGAVELAPALGFPPEMVRYILFASVVLLPAVVALAWYFDVSREGIIRDPGDQPTLGVGDADTLATMPTALGTDDGAGAVIVRWEDVEGQGAAMFREAFFIGRGAECSVRFYDPLVSRKHARIYPEAGVWMIEDLGSRNGTLLDEQRIAAPTVLAFASALRVNEAGPLLRIEPFIAGAVDPAVAARLRDGPAVAHVRSPARDLAATARSVPT